MKMLGLIPARSGSKRIADKNIKVLAGHPLLAYSIASALDCWMLDKVIVSTDSTKYAQIAQHYGADVMMRPEMYATDTSPDIEWVRDLLLKVNGYDAFAILRPTSPFRLTCTIERAIGSFLAKDCDSLRAVEKCKQHPAKMWVARHGYIHPLLPMMTGSTGAPGHSSQYQSLPDVYVQNASLEVAWTKTVMEQDSIAGEVVRPFFTENYEGYDVNTALDFRVAEELVRDGKAVLPEVKVKSWLDT